MSWFNILKPEKRKGWGCWHKRIRGNMVLPLITYLDGLMWLKSHPEPSWHWLP